jgi:FkbM family methyltransferase
MAEVRAGDQIADVGASIGLYALALARRAGPEGRIYAFEPDPQSVKRLQGNVSLNHLESRIQVLPFAVAATDGFLPFVAGRGVESHIASDGADTGGMVQTLSLDSVFADKRCDLLKIDVEGYEESILRGSVGLLSDPARAPRAIFIEMHPFAWSEFGYTDRELLHLLETCRYEVFDLNGDPVHRITTYGEVVARRAGGQP